MARNREPAGTVVPMLVLLQLVGVAITPLNVSVLLPGVAPKRDPAMTTGVPIGPEASEGPVRLAVSPSMGSRPASDCYMLVPDHHHREGAGRDGRVRRHPEPVGEQKSGRSRSPGRAR